MRMTGAFAPFRLAMRDRALILTYHRFSAASALAATPARAFREQLDYLSARYRIVPLSAMARALASGESLTQASVAITIDDGYSDAYEIAFPILRRYNAPATLFVVTDFLDRKTWLWTDKLRFLTSRTDKRNLETTIAGRTLRAQLSDASARLDAADRVNSLLKALPDESKDEAIDRLSRELSVTLPAAPPAEFAPVTWDQAREMDSSGVEIGSHTITHPILTRVSDDRLATELVESRARLEAALNHGVDLFCYPNGDYDSKVRDEVARAGYACAVTTEAGFNDKRSDPLSLKRIHTACDLAHFIQATSGFEQVKNRLRPARKPSQASAQPLERLSSPLTDGR